MLKKMKEIMDKKLNAKRRTIHEQAVNTNKETGVIKRNHVQVLGLKNTRPVIKTH
jgi:hypothetical protein